MNLHKVIKNHVEIAVVRSCPGKLLITDTQSALDLMMSVKYQTGATRVILSKQAVAEQFFILSNGTAGEILQQWINYGMKVAFWGDYSHYTSKPLQDFIRESNRGRDFFFVSTEEEALKKLSA